MRKYSFWYHKVSIFIQIFLTLQVWWKWYGNCSWTGFLIRFLASLPQSQPEPWRAKAKLEHIYLNISEPPMRLLPKAKEGSWGFYFPCFFFFFYENLSLSKFIMKKIAISKCALFVECRCKNFLVEFQVLKTIVLNTVAIQVQFKDPMEIFKRSKD